MITAKTITDEQILDYRENGPRTADAWRACGWASGNMPGYRDHGRRLVVEMINERDARLRSHGIVTATSITDDDEVRELRAEQAFDTPLWNTADIALRSADGALKHLARARCAEILNARGCK